MYKFNPELTATHLQKQTKLYNWCKLRWYEKKIGYLQHTCRVRYDVTYGRNPPAARLTATHLQSKIEKKTAPRRHFSYTIIYTLANQTLSLSVKSDTFYLAIKLTFCLRGFVPDSIDIGMRGWGSFPSKPPTPRTRAGVAGFYNTHVQI